MRTTPSQTVGPFFEFCLHWPDGPEVVGDATPGALWLYGRVVDGEGQPIPDALIETWQADSDGRFDHADDPRGAVHGFRGFGRCPTDADGHYAIRTLKPGCVPGEDGRDQAPHIDVTVLSRGLLRRLVTRVYFADEVVANSSDALLERLPVDARRTLLAERTAEGYRFDIRLQGDHETAFFDL